MGKVKVSKKLRMAAKGSDTPNYRHALKLGIHPSLFSKLITGAEPVSRNDARVLAIAREFGVSAEEAFEEIETSSVQQVAGGVVS